MLTSADQVRLTDWLCQRIGYEPTQHMRVIAREDVNGRIIGAVGFDRWNGKSCEMHCAGEGNWLSRELLGAIFRYPFEVAGCSVVLAIVDSANERALRLNEHAGFERVATIEGGHPDGDLVIMQMRREKCRWIQEVKDGQEVESAAAA